MLTPSQSHITLTFFVPFHLIYKQFPHADNFWRHLKTLGQKKKLIIMSIFSGTQGF